MTNLLFEASELITTTTPRQMRHALEQVTAAYVPQPQLRNRMHLCASEALTNLVLHANHHHGRVMLQFGRDNQGWWLAIRDDCASWDPTLDVEPGRVTEFSDIEQGRGTALLDNQADTSSYHYDSQTQDNLLRLTWAFPAPQQRQRILLVEDNNSLRLLYANYLHEFDIEIAENGTEALTKLAKGNIDLILSDIRMPEMNGIALRKKLDQQPQCERVAFIFLTAEDSDDMQAHASTLGIDDYVVKPVSKHQLLRIIHRVLARSTQLHSQLSKRLSARLNENITASLQPQLPEFAHGWRCCVGRRDTGSGGGDLLLHNHSDEQLQLVITDVMGHDDNAKFFAHTCAGYIHGLMQTIASNTHPGQLLTQLSHYAFTDNLLSQITLTSCSVQLAAAGELRIASAGHPPPLLISESGIDKLAATGIMPGLIADASYASAQFWIRAGQRVALYTDGLFESARDNAARKLLETRIIEALQQTRQQPLDEAVAYVMKVFDQGTGSQPCDDALLLLLEPQLVKSSDNDLVTTSQK